MKFRNDKGFTLVETMISATILGVGIMGMAAMQGMAAGKNVDATDMSVVTNTAADMMERIQNNRRWAWTYNGIGTAGPGNCAAVPAPAPAPKTPEVPVDIAAQQESALAEPPVDLPTARPELSGEEDVVYGNGPTTEDSIVEFIQNYPDSAVKFLYRKNLDNRPLPPVEEDIYQHWERRGMSLFYCIPCSMG